MNHVKMRHVAVAVLAIAFSGVPAFPQQPDRSPPARVGDLSAILEAWVHGSSRIKSFSAKLTRRDKRHRLSATGEDTYEVLWKASGQAVLKIEAAVGKDKSELMD